MADIPPIIWTAWFQGWEEAPPVVRACLQSWQRRNREWQVRPLDATTMRDVIDVDQISPSFIGRTFSPQALSDLLRVALLSRYGGVWVDATTWCAKPLTQWLEGCTESGFFAFERPGPDRMISSWFLAAERGSTCMPEWSRACQDYWLGRSVEDEYFWFHYTFAEVYERSTSFALMWDRTPKVSALPPHDFQIRMAETCTALDRERLAGSDQPVYKFDHRCSDPCPSSVYAAITNYWES